MSEIRRGAAAIQEAAEASGQGGSFRPYLPPIFWKEDHEERYVLFLNEIDDIGLYDMVQFIKDERDHYQETIAKTSPPFSERVDPFVKKKGAKTVERNVAIAVELEPVFEVVKIDGKTRRKPRGFEVKTTEYERRILDDDGEVTDETEEVTTPVIGYISQSPNNFFNHVANYDANDAPIVSTALKITRLGKDKNTSYSVQGYDEQPIDLDNLIAFIDGFSYLNDEMEDVIEQAGELEPREFSQWLGKLLLDKREAELLDDERYQELLAGVEDDSMDIYNKNKSKAKKEGSSKAKGRQPRSARQAPADDGDDPAEEPSDPEPTEEVTPKGRTRKTAPKAEKTKASSATLTSKERMEQLRKRAEEKKAAKAK